MHHHRMAIWPLLDFQKGTLYNSVCHEVAVGLGATHWSCRQTVDVRPTSSTPLFILSTIDEFTARCNLTIPTFNFSPWRSFNFFRGLSTSSLAKIIAQSLTSVRRPNQNTPLACFSSFWPMTERVAYLIDDWAEAGIVLILGGSY